MMKNVIISNPKELEKAKKSMFESGAKRLHVVSDFDRTLTTAFVDGKKRPSLMSILRDGNYLTSDYAQKAHELYDKYHPIEIDPTIPFEEKKKAMHEWWMTHFDLLIKLGLNKKDLEKVVDTGKLKFRDGFGKFMNLLHQNSIPLLIISSGGLGGDAIAMYLEREGKLYENVYIISNSYKWDKEGNALGVKQPIIHVMNKDETAIQDFPVFKVIKDRKNVLLLGDTLDDVGMVHGFDCENLIKIGFLNEKEEENLEHYKRNFNVVILHDGSMKHINGLLRDIIK